MILQLMDFEQKVRKNGGSLGGLRRLFTRLRLSNLNVASKVKVLVPLSIYLLVMTVLIKLMYDTIFGKNNDGSNGKSSILSSSHGSSEDEELVCV